MKFTLYTADCTGNAKNTLYPHQKVITSEAELKKAVASDHACAKYDNDTRSDANFQFSDVVPMDCDNDHSDNLDDWVTPEKLTEMSSIDNLADLVMNSLREYSELTDTAMKKAVRKTAASVRKEISENAPKRTGDYAKSWATKKVTENSHTLEMTVHSKDRYQIAHLLEKGHAKRNGGRVAAIPHIAPAEENGAELLESLIKKELA